MTEEPPLDHKCRDKFLVQSVGISASDEIGNVQSVVSGSGQVSVIIELMSYSGPTSKKTPAPRFKKRKFASISCLQLVEEQQLAHTMLPRLRDRALLHMARRISRQPTAPQPLTRLHKVPTPRLGPALHRNTTTHPPETAEV